MTGWTLGLMSGTSLDGIDVALLKSDGERVTEFGPSGTFPYDPEFRAALRSVLGGKGPVADVERALTARHAEAVEALLSRHGISAEDIALIGFHGHTILHAPEARRTWQIGDGPGLAARLGVPVVSDFRGADVAAGGQGAPLVPVYHAALAQGLERPLAVVNIGGVANVTWMGRAQDALIACDTGPGNALIDDVMLRAFDRPYDAEGTVAAAGRVERALVDSFLRHPYFAAAAPKSLDRDAFAVPGIDALGPEDSVATLTAITVETIAAVRAILPEAPARWLVTGGGRHNQAILRGLAPRLQAPVEPVEAVGWDGDALEAQAFAFLAQRSLKDLPLTFPGTTGVSARLSGGQVSYPASRSTIASAM